MTDDERAIRELIDTWMQASRRADIETLLGLMTDDIVFMTPGREPFGKQEFRAQFEAMSGAEMIAPATRSLFRARYRKVTSPPML